MFYSEAQYILFNPFPFLPSRIFLVNIILWTLRPTLLIEEDD